MKCEKCGKDWPECTCFGKCPPPKNPSPRDIFAHIKTKCERKAFDEFMEWNDKRFRCGWNNPIGEGIVLAIRADHPDWYKWLVCHNLLPKKAVKRQAWAFLSWSNDEARRVQCNAGYDSQKDAEESGRWSCPQRFIKTILLHEWEEEE